MFRIYGSPIHLSRALCELTPERITATYLPSRVTSSPSMVLTRPCEISPAGLTTSGLATLFRHFPTREALFEALLRTNLDALTQSAGELEASNPPDEALLSWFREVVAFVQSYRGVVDLMAAAHADPDSPLYASCAAVHLQQARDYCSVLRPKERRAHRYRWGRPVRPGLRRFGWSRSSDNPSFTLARARSSLKCYRECHPDKLVEQQCREATC